MTFFLKEWQCDINMSAYFLYEYEYFDFISYRFFPKGSCQYTFFAHFEFKLLGKINLRLVTFLLKEWQCDFLQCTQKNPSESFDSFEP